MKQGQREDEYCEGADAFRSLEETQRASGSNVFPMALPKKALELVVEIQWKHVLLPICLLPRLEGLDKQLLGRTGPPSAIWCAINALNSATPVMRTEKRLAGIA